MTTKCIRRRPASRQPSLLPTPASIRKRKRANAYLCTPRYMCAFVLALMLADLPQCQGFRGSVRPSRRCTALDPCPVLDRRYHHHDSATTTASATATTLLLTTTRGPVRTYRQLSALSMATSSSDLKKQQTLKKRKTRPSSKSKSKSKSTSKDVTTTSTKSKSTATTAAATATATTTTTAATAATAATTTATTAAATNGQESVVKRLSRAAKAAHARQKMDEQAPKDDEALASISALTKAIDSELMSPSQHEIHKGATHYHSRRKVRGSVDGSSVMNLLEHNQHLDSQIRRNAEQKEQRKEKAKAMSGVAAAAGQVADASGTTTVVVNGEADVGNATVTANTTMDNATTVVDSPMIRLKASHVAIVFSKPLIKDEITIEYASRLMSLAHSIKNGLYKPDLVCLLTNPIPSSEHNQLTDATVGYIFFKQLCSAQDIDLSHTNVCIVPAAHSSIDGIGSLHPVVQAIEHGNFLKNWLADSTEFERSTDEYGLKRDVPRKKVHIHFRLFSSDYHLCNLNDIYQRSPRQSVLNTLRSMSNPSSSPSIRQRGVIQTSWSFQHSTYPYVYSNDDLTAFLGKTYVMGQQLRPLLVNLRGVQSNAEFFQTDNYQQLVAVRRSFVTQIEELNNYYYNQNSNTMTVDEDNNVDNNSEAKAKAKLKKRMSQVPTQFGVTLDVTLENALLRLGRCLDLLRSSTKQASTMPMENWIQASTNLEKFLEQIQGCCDPDHPLHGEDWGKLRMDEIEHNP